LCPAVVSPNKHANILEETIAGIADYLRFVSDVILHIAKGTQWEDESPFKEDINKCIQENSKKIDIFVEKLSV
jgi:hypothetical protein